MTDLIMFISGVMFVVVLMPILQSLTNAICAWIEILNGKAQEKVSRANLEITKLQCEMAEIQDGLDDDECGQPMGFHLDNCDC